MSFVRLIKRAIQLIIPPAVFLGLTAYFGWNAFQGDHGMRAYQHQLVLRQQALKAEHDATVDQEIWKRRIGSMDERALDADTLDERSRAMLNLAENDDLVIPYAPNDKLY